jgi:hypothetical protein
VRNLATTLLLCLVACKSAPAVKAEADTSSSVQLYYPLEVGNSWTYSVSGSPEKAVIEIIGRDGEWYLDDHRSRLRYEEGGVRDADRFLLRPPLKAGTRWTAVENLMVQRFEITGADATVVTEAGTFTHCVVVRTSSTVKKDLTFVTEWTYAPKVGIAQIVTSTVDGRGKVDEQTRLTLSAVHLGK